MGEPIMFHTTESARSGDIDAPLIVLGPSLGTTTDVWAGVVPSLTATYRVLCFDLPGHGFGPRATTPFTVEDVAKAVIGLVDSIGVDTFHYAGVSLGGAIGLALAVNHPTRLDSLVDFCSGAKIGHSDAWTARAATVRASGTASLIAGTASRWFAPEFISRRPQDVFHALGQLADIDDESYALACEALALFDQTDALSRIRTPICCVSGEYDNVTPTEQVQELAARIPHARAIEMAGVAHLPALEQPTEVSALLLEWLRNSVARKSLAGLAAAPSNTNKTAPQIATDDSTIRPS